MKAIEVISANNMKVVDIDMPTDPVGDEVLIEIKAGGICGSDLHIYKGENAGVKLPLVIGHELVGSLHCKKGFPDSRENVCVTPPTWESQGQDQLPHSSVQRKIGASHI